VKAAERGSRQDEHSDELEVVCGGARRGAARDGVKAATDSTAVPYRQMTGDAAGGANPEGRGYGVWNMVCVFEELSREKGWAKN
jgi:hypothetical protein